MAKNIEQSSNFMAVRMRNGHYELNIGVLTLDKLMIQVYDYPKGLVIQRFSLQSDLIALMVN
jgi:hypothetical protein